MKIILHKRIAVFLLAGAMAFFASCNKDVADPMPIVPATPSGQSLTDFINSDASFTILKAAIAKASTSTATPSLATLLADRTAEFTVFAPTDAAFQASGIASAAVINSTAFRAGQLDTLLRYHITGGKIYSASFSTALPNVQLPSQFVLSAPSATLPPGLRMSVFPSKNAGVFWANNVPITQVDIAAANGVIHKLGVVLFPPSQFLWDRINTDANLTYLKAAVQRADSGVVAASTLQAALQNPAANLTVFAPTNAAMQAFLTGSITQALIARGLPPATAQAAATALVSAYGTTLLTNPASIPDAPIFPAGTGIGLALSSALSPTSVKGLAVYHLLGTRAFTVNLPLTAAKVQTLLNTAIPAHPGVTVKATFGANGVVAATVQGLTNTTASNLLINPLPAPAGTSDQHYINGALHFIDQVLLPQ